jgi:ribosomal-protein-alanine N-acetyltransferase
LVNSEGWLEFIGDRNVHSLDDALEYIRRILKTPDFTYWVVRIRETNTPIGIISFLKRTYLEHFDIGFAFVPESNGQGYAYEAAKGVLAIVGKEPRFRKIVATTLPTNVSSIKLLKKLGLRFENEIQVGAERVHLYIN